MSKTKIVVLHLKEVIYTTIFVGLGILLIILLVVMFGAKDNDGASGDDTTVYKPGVYTSQMTLKNAILNLEVVVDVDHVKSVRFVNLDDSVTTMYPLVESSLKAIESQLLANVKIDDVEIPEDSKYTSLLIVETLEKALKKAVPD